MPTLDEIVEETAGALNETAEEPEGQETAVGASPATETTPEEQGEPAAEATDDESEEGVTPEATEGEIPNPLVPRQRVDQLTERLRAAEAQRDAMQALYESAVGGGRTKQETPEPEEEPADPYDVMLAELAEIEAVAPTETDARAYAMIRALVEDRKSERAELAEIRQNHMAQRVQAEAARQFQAAVADLQAEAGVSFTEEQIQALGEATVALAATPSGRSQPLPYLVAKAAMKLTQADKPQAAPKPDPAVEAARQAKEGLAGARPASRAPAPGTKPDIGHMGLDEAVEAAFRAVGS